MLWGAGRVFNVATVFGRMAIPAVKSAVAAKSVRVRCRAVSSSLPVAKGSHRSAAVESAGAVGLPVEAGQAQAPKGVGSHARERGTHDPGE
jgi:hypothetical protein